MLKAINIKWDTSDEEWNDTLTSSMYGTKFPEIHKCEDIAPYEIRPIRAYSFRQKEAKTITVYE